MARHRIYTRGELLDAAERLLVERGYDGFQIKALSESLHGARSTIYEYFSNKDEIVAACMRRTMESVIHACAELDGMEPVAAIKRMLAIFVEQSSFHAVMQAAPKVNPGASATVKTDLDYLDSAHSLLKERMLALFTRAQQEGVMRKDVPLPVMGALFFHAIDTPNWLQLPPEQWVELLFAVWWEGASSSM